MEITAFRTALVALGWSLTAYWLSFDAVFIAMSIILGIFLNLGTREAGQWSAYAVFNRGQQRLLGDLRADQIEGELRRRDVKKETIDLKERMRILEGRRCEIERELDKYQIG